jgi:hypothetical protein
MNASTFTPHHIPIYGFCIYKALGSFCLMIKQKSRVAMIANAASRGIKGVR